MKGRITTEKGKTAYYLDGVKVSKKRFYRSLACPDPGKVGDSPGGASASGWPMTSEALAVHPKQVAKANERNRRNGVNVSYDPKTGEALIPDNAEYRKLQKLEGVHQNNRYY